jgi:uncharacterized protein (DUF433 family)
MEIRLCAMKSTVSQIEIDDQGAAWITGANTKVIEVVLDKLAYGWSPEEMHFQHPHLSLGQIHAALAYYYEHQEQLDSDIARRRKEVEQMAAESADSPLRRRLLDLKKS